ncbi:DUF6464 family protein [Trichocoleus desertorum AS-A10]|uniref:DUF6464 family protein n=1 Tax=Trichocoleus desertorum TaxID=1481672 RepID=UPI003299FF3D
MIEIILVITLGLLPPLLSLWLLQRAETRAQNRLRAAMVAAERRSLQNLRRASSDQRYVEGMGLLTGDITCRFNARSAHLRCAVNPLGPCQDCRYYESIEFS